MPKVGTTRLGHETVLKANEGVCIFILGAVNPFAIVVAIKSVVYFGDFGVTNAIVNVFKHVKAGEQTLTEVQLVSEQDSGFNGERTAVEEHLNAIAYCGVLVEPNGGVVTQEQRTVAVYCKVSDSLPHATDHKLLYVFFISITKQGN